ncbi:MAG: hypothetical protein SFV22_14025, partial [Saprospiraceae bacterium]|nr:hypothetical protein [Saprospiraceae bacterium]
PVVYYFHEEDLAPAGARRDTDAERRQAQDHMETIIFPPEEDEVNELQLNLWLEEFKQSTHFAELQPEIQEEVRGIVKMFSAYAFDYRGEQPADWKVGTVREVCLELFPRKFTAEIEHFEQISPVLSRFFGFLADKQYQKNAGALRRELEKIAPDIVRQAKNPLNWGMAKSMMMQALDVGVDLNDAQALDTFMANYTAGLNMPSRLRPVQQNPFKHLSRNAIIKVKYADGTIREGKFKRLEEDLKAGKCALL